MRMYDIILKKREGHEFSEKEINFFIDGYTKNEIPDYQMSVLLMAIFFKGMSKKETAFLTMAMAKSGDMFDLSSIKGIKVDKHSTGGVGDKTSLIIGPIVASFGVPVAKMSGRGLGHTGGTVDKMEAFPNFKTSLNQEEFFDIVKNIGISIIGQSGNIAPADKKIYALRDVTATVDNISLIAASIMSKKLASGSDAILLDVKAGSGAFMKTIDDAINLAQEMVDIGLSNGRKMSALITDMDIPLGYAIGNTLELIEVIETLSGNGPDDLTQLCIELSANMLKLAGFSGDTKSLVKKSIQDGSALAKLREMVVAQGSFGEYVDDVSKFEKAKFTYSVKSKNTGYIYSIDTEKCGISSVVLGAGRARKEDDIDYSAGIILKKKTGDFVNIGDEIAIFHTKNIEIAQQAEKLFLESITIKTQQPNKTPIIYASIIDNKVTKY